MMNFLAKQWWRLVGFGFRLFYNEMAFTYDTVSAVVSLGEWRNWQRATLKFLPASDAGCVLELAHGTGNLHLDLHHAGYRMVGYDLSPYMGRITTRKLLRRGLQPCLVNGRAQHLPFADASFSAVISTFPTNFIFETQTLNEVKRVLQDNGVLIVVLNGVLTGGGVIQTVIDCLYRVTGQGSPIAPIVSNPFDTWGASPTIENHQVTYKRSYTQVFVLHKTKTP
jgi:ubiquinone/menaquinone biosynthesis C-methylase UbiE